MEAACKILPYREDEAYIRQTIREEPVAELWTRGPIYSVRKRCKSSSTPNETKNCQEKGVKGITAVN
jgi:hypothetical protein